MELKFGRILLKRYDKVKKFREVLMELFIEGKSNWMETFVVID